MQRQRRRHTKRSLTTTSPRRDLIVLMCLKNLDQKQETLPQFLERYEIVLHRLREANSEITSTTSIERLLHMMPWELKYVAHQVTGSLTLNNDFACVRALLETEYKAAITTCASNHPRGASNDDRALST